MSSAFVNSADFKELVIDDVTSKESKGSYHVFPNPSLPQWSGSFKDFLRLTIHSSQFWFHFRRFPSDLLWFFCLPFRVRVLTSWCIHSSLSQNYIIYIFLKISLSMYLKVILILTRIKFTSLTTLLMWFFYDVGQNVDSKGPFHGLYLVSCFPLFSPFPIFITLNL